MEYSKKIPVKKSWGQNFIIDQNVINKIISIIDPNPNDIILEIGPGKGALTIPLSKKINRLYAVEIDPLLVKYLKSKKINNTDIINKRALCYDLVYSPEITPFIEKSKNNNIETIGGLTMLVFQAIKGFELVTGKNAPVGKMLEAVGIIKNIED